MPGIRRLPPGYLRISEAAERCGLTPRTLHAMRQQHRGPRSTLMNGLVAYKPEWIDDFLAECESSSGSPGTPRAERRARPAIAIPVQQPRRRRSAA